MDEFIKILGRSIPRSEWEEDERLMYLTLMDMFSIVTLIREMEKGPSKDEPPELARVRERLFNQVWSNPDVMKRLNDAKKKFLAEIEEALSDKEETE